MSSNEIKKSYNNGTGIKMNRQANLNLNQKTTSNYDGCFVNQQTMQSVGPGNYMTENIYSCECSIPEVVETATNQPNVFYRNGYGPSGCVVDENSNLRVGKSRKFPKCPNQLFTRPFLTVPYMGRGPGNPYLETQLLPGEDTSVKRSCNTLSEITINNMFTPMVDHLSENVQNPVHIIPEVAQEGWIRGGVPSRLVVRDVDYLEKCGYKYMDKKYASEFWKDKHIYL